VTTNAPKRKAGLLSLYSGSQVGLDFSDGLQCITGKVMFPDTEDEPSVMSQRFCNQTVPKLVRGELPSPKQPVAHRHVEMPRATMPEAPVHENDDALPAKDKIGFSEDGRMSSPTGDFVPPQKAGKCDLRGLVAASANA
jgi:hypothetical protein